MIVQHRERLQGGHRSVPRGRELRRVGTIHGIHERIRQGPENETINAPAPRVAAVNIEVVVIDLRRDVDTSLEQELTCWRAAHREINLSGNGKYGVAQ